MSTKSNLDALFDEKRKRQDAVAEANKAEQQTRDYFLEQFLVKVEEVVRPTMTELGEYLKTKGWEYQIVTQKEGTSMDRGQPRLLDESISLRMFPDGQVRHPAHENPALTVIADKVKKEVRFHECTMSPGAGGHAGSAGSCPLEGLTKQLLDDKITKVIRYVLGR